MPRLNYLLVSQMVIVDQASNSVSAINIIDEVRSPGFPLFIPSLSVLLVWEREDADNPGEDLQSVMRITLPGEAPIVQRTNMRLTANRHRIVQMIHGVQVLREGQIVVEVLLNEVQCGTYRVPVIQDETIPAENVVNFREQ